MGFEMFHADRQTDMTKLIVAFRSSTKAPKKHIKTCCRHSVWMSNLMINKVYITAELLGGINILAHSRDVSISLMLRSEHPCHQQWHRIWTSAVLTLPSYGLQMALQKFSLIVHILNLSSNLINFRFSPYIIIVNHFYCPTNALNYTKHRG